MKKVIIVDDHKMVAIGIKSYLQENSQWTVTQCLTNSADTINFLKSSQAEDSSAIIIDIDLGNESGFELAEEIKKQFNDIKIILYSIHDETGYVLKAKEIGVNGYVSKAAEPSEIITCLEKIYNNENYFEELLSNKQNKINDILNLLTKKESAILKEILANKTNDQIAEELCMSKHSVETYCSRIYEKTMILNRKDLLEKYGK